MKISKFLSFAAGVSLLTASLLPAKVSAASVSLSLSGATNTNGTFSAVVYEDSGSARVTLAKIDLAFSGAVSNVSYDYSVGPFSNSTNSGAGATQGYVTGQQPVARVTFKMANPGSVTTSAGGSYLKGTNDEGTQVITHSVSGGAATFTYNAPANNGGGSNPAPTTPAPTTSNPTKKTTSTGTENNGTVAGAETQAETTAAPAEEAKKDDKDNKKSEEKNADSKNTSSSSSAWFWPMAIIAIVAGYVAARTIQKRKIAAAAESKSAKTQKSTPAKKTRKN